ncbi:MAG: TIGR01777 family protein [Bacteroidetes bacterium]|nr:TIGR01777 family protein [Bacteroidota bacterium]
MKTVLIAGGTGLIGSTLSNLLNQKGYKVYKLTRKAKKRGHIYWNPYVQTIEGRNLSKINIIINLVGANIGEKKWTEKRKKELLESRVNTTRYLFNMRTNFPNLEYYIGASGINCYGMEPVSSPHVESDPYGPDYLSQLVKSWEESSTLFQQHYPASILRIASVLDKNGGVISKMKLPVWFGLGSPMGSGEQLMPWIHVEDLCEMIIHCIENRLNGTYNAVASCDPNKEVMRALGKAMHRPFFMPKVPAQLFKWLYGEMSVLILGSVNASNEKIKASGFNFRYPKIQEAVKQLLSKK